MSGVGSWMQAAVPVVLLKLVLILVLVLVGLGRAAAWADVGGGEASGNEVSVTVDYLSESDVLNALEQGTEGNCFLDTITIGEDECIYDLGVVEFEMVCIRCDMNVPMALVEASDRQGLLSIDTPDLENDMRDLNANMSPAEKTMVQRVGDFVSASATTQGRCINMFLVEGIIKQVLDGISFDILCSPLFETTHTPYGYGFASEGDHQNGTEFGNWRGIISDYWYVPWLTPFTAIARALETPGLCPVDWYKMFCHGAWGTVYPSAGVNPAESQTMNLSDSAYDALNPTYASFMTYGPLHLRLGADLVDTAHSAASYQLGSDANYAMLTRGGYIEPLFPTNLKSCLNTAEVGNDVDSSMQVWEPAITAKPITETNSNQVTDAPNYSDQGRNIAAALWPRFTCCNYCAGSYQAAEKHFDVGKGFWPQLIDGD